MCIRPFLCCIIVMALIVMLFPAMQAHSTGSALFGNAHGMGGDVNEQEFTSIPDVAKPWVYWFWINGNVTRESVTRELEALREKGVGGFLLVDIRGYHDDLYGGNIPVPLRVKLKFMSPEWRDMVRHVMREADRLGLKMSMNLANTGGALRGPWDMGPKGPKRLIWTASTVQGPAAVSASLEPPAQEDHSWDVALLAVKIGEKIRGADYGPVNLGNKWYEVNDRRKGDAALAQKIIDLREYVADGRLNWEAPAGEWRILRFVCATFETGEQHGGASAGKGSVDILNADAVATYFDLMGNQLIDDAGPLAGTTLKYFYNVSWEGTYPNWTHGFAEEFRNYRGYPITPYLPVLAGMVVENMSVSRRFMQDYYLTISDLFRNNCYRNIGKLCHARGMQWHSENGGPWNRNEPLFNQADMLAFWGLNDMPQAEFWVDGYRKPRSNARFAAMAAHTYGRPLVAIEAFTHMDFHWSKYPAYLKPIADMNYIDGVNMFVWHTFSSSPKEAGLPGYEYFAGTHINPNITWWDEAGNFFQYLGRCQYLLQKGRYAADVLTYVSDKNYVRWGRGEEWCTEPSLTLGPGYKYDLVNTEILINRLSIKDGKLVLPDSMEYRMLIVDLEDETIPPEALKAIYKLLENGAAVMLGKRRPASAPGLKNYPESDREVQTFSMKLWGDESGVKERLPIGKGTLITGESPDEALRDSGILPDFEGPFEYIHRTAEGLDIYFISGTGRADCVFRVTGIVPEFWNPVSGRVTDAVHYRIAKDGRTIIPIDLPENGSVFIVFRRSGEHNHFTGIDGPARGLEVVSRNESAVNVHVWETGLYRLKTARGNSIELQAKVPASVDISDLWQVNFAEGWGAPAKTVFKNLIPWNTHTEPGIKYFSGKAVYRKTFQLSQNQAGLPARLRLGEVYNLAHVRLNGRDLKTEWTAPWTVDVTDILKTGNNSLEIEVTNCWANRLIGDAGLPPDERYTNTNVRLISERGNYRGFEAYAADDPLLPSGLVGPVRIEFGEQHRIEY